MSTGLYLVPYITKTRYRTWRTDIQEIFVDWLNELELDRGVKGKGEGGAV